MLPAAATATTRATTITAATTTVIPTCSLCYIAAPLDSYALCHSRLLARTHSHALASRQPMGNVYWLLVICAVSVERGSLGLWNVFSIQCSARLGRTFYIQIYEHLHSFISIYKYCYFDFHYVFKLST